MDNKVRQAIPKKELKEIMKRFLADKNRGISIPLFAELAGVSNDHLRDVFIDQIQPLTEYMQWRVSKAYTEWQNGEVSVMQNQDRSRFVQYRKTPKPIYKKSASIKLVDGQVRLKVGLVNKYDYSEMSLDEQLKRG